MYTSELASRAFMVSFPDADTFDFEMEIEEGDSTETVTLRIIMEDDSTARFEIIKGDLPIMSFREPPRRRAI
ncbi:MAG: hypothetical protein JW913_16860 [Chitinispirillaceae bacterium]|nr:hypothetical protein [Chitinispirillaceae bacterium]